MWRRVVGSGYWLLALLLAAACGGNVEGGSREPKESPSKSEPSAPASNHESETGNPDANVDLGDCTLGRPEYPSTADPCPWVADERCYQTREMACNCACPRTHDSQCASGFDDGPDGHVWVACD